MGLFVASSAECLRYISFLGGNICHIYMFMDLTLRLIDIDIDVAHTEKRQKKVLKLNINNTFHKLSKKTSARN